MPNRDGNDNRFETTRLMPQVHSYLFSLGTAAESLVHPVGTNHGQNQCFLMVLYPPITSS